MEGRKKGRESLVKISGLNRRLSADPMFLPFLTRRFLGPGRMAANQTPFLGISSIPTREPAS